MRFLDVGAVDVEVEGALVRGIALEFGSWGSGERGGFGGGNEGALRGEGECDGKDDGGDMEVMSTDGERARWREETEDGEGESSSAAGGGSTKWNVREAI